MRFLKRPAIELSNFARLQRAARPYSIVEPRTGANGKSAPPVFPQNSVVATPASTISPWSAKTRIRPSGALSADAVSSASQVMPSAEIEN
jgi:hypothetical protein